MINQIYNIKKQKLCPKNKLRLLHRNYIQYLELSLVSFLSSGKARYFAFFIRALKNTYC